MVFIVKVAIVITTIDVFIDLREIYKQDETNNDKIRIKRGEFGDSDLK
jgi:hypothetical protein